jgi:hypothetical protein
MSNETPAARRFRILAIVDDVNACECCGRSELLRTVAIENTETGEIKYFGTTCAMQPAKGFQIEKAEMKQALRDLETRQLKAKRERNEKIFEKAFAWRDAEYTKRGGAYYQKENPLPDAHPDFKIWTLPTNPQLLEECRKEAFALFPLEK